ncbi:hypothetical protein [Roseovarius arcticus]|uniref:hypothetical protein n=1 Tax=Roseovarius arcticus TaxID=2547404 RepID=UPI00111066DD|nr:hypothetical protein [Roseovarius arcticus]
MLNFRGHWCDRIHAEGLTPNSANKDLTHLGDVLKTVNHGKVGRMGLTPEFDFCGSAKIR